MKIIKLNQNLLQDYREEIAEAALVLKRGGVVMHPTETCYGLAADIFDKSALTRLYALKKMPATKPVSVMVRNLAEAETYADFGGQYKSGAGNMVSPRDLAKEFWPGPLTLVLPRRESLPVFLNEGLESVGLRCPACESCLDLMEEYGGPLTTTSANLTQWPEVYDVDCYLKQLLGEELKPDLILDGGPLQKNRPSTIIHFENGEMKLIREGALWQKIREKY